MTFSQSRLECKHSIITLIFLLLLTITAAACGGDNGTKPAPNPDPVPDPVEQDTFEVTPYVTTATKTKLLKQEKGADWADSGSGESTIVVEPGTTYQTMVGYGFSLTGGSAQVIYNSPKRDEIINDIMNEMKVSYVRVSLGASDLSTKAYTYDDMTQGQEDFDLEYFDIKAGDEYVIPVLKQMLAIREFTILASPWSPPAWMKTEFSLKGGHLREECYDVYARYMLKYFQEMDANGIHVNQLTPQNEPQHGGNMPSLWMDKEEQYNYVQNHLGPMLADSGYADVEILGWDHNADNTEYPIFVAQSEYIDGSAFHLYNGGINALSNVYAATGKDVYFTEQWTGSNGTFDGDFKWHMENITIGAARHFARGILEWNFASDPNYDPHTEGGCTMCKGAFTINGEFYTRNVGYYIISQASRFVPTGSVRIKSNDLPHLTNVAFKNGNKTVLIVFNKSDATQNFNINQGDKYVSFSLESGAAGTYVWFD